MHPAVLSSLQKIPVEEMQIYLKAADVGVFPYRRSLNSGALSLALTFGLPIILPAHSGEVTTVEPSYAEVYDASVADGLLTAMSNARRFIAPEAREAAAAAARRHAPPKVAGEFAASLRNWLSRGS
jgi:glycosyltransferase involved in cell wall biosynthesis